MQIRNNTLPVRFVIFAATLFVLIFTVENINKHFWLNDLKVYYSAAQALMNGEQVYGIPFGLGSGYYKYSPFTSFLFIPYALLPYTAAAILHYFVLAAVVICLFVVVRNILNIYFFHNNIKKENALLILAFICTLVHLVRELHLGNINVILLLMLSLSLWFILKSKQGWAGVLLAVVIITKPFFILLLIPLALRKYFKAIFTIGISMIVFVLMPALVVGIQNDIGLHKEWLNTMLGHNAGFPSSNTIENLVRLYISSDISNALSYFILGIVCIGSVLFFFANKSFEQKKGNNESRRNTGFIMEWLVLIALMPSLFKTDTQHFLLSLPLLMILLCYLSLAKNYVLIASFVVLMLMYGGNLPDLVGKALSARLEATGMLGISNLIILIASILVYFKFLRKQGEFSVNS